jgi:hypothetical protein
MPKTSATINDNVSARLANSVISSFVIRPLKLVKYYYAFAKESSETLITSLSYTPRIDSLIGGIPQKYL